MDAMIPIRITQITISMVVKPERRMTVSSRSAENSYHMPCHTLSC